MMDNNTGLNEVGTTLLLAVFGAVMIPTGLSIANQPGGACSNEFEYKDEHGTLRRNFVEAALYKDAGHSGNRLQITIRQDGRIVYGESVEGFADEDVENARDVASGACRTGQVPDDLAKAVDLDSPPPTMMSYGPIGLL